MHSSVGLPDNAWSPNNELHAGEDLVNASGSSLCLYLKTISTMLLKMDAEH